MPGRDGTGPLSKRSVLGRGTGRRGQQGPMGAGPTNFVCPKCGTATIRGS